MHRDGRDVRLGPPRIHFGATPLAKIGDLADLAEVAPTEGTETSWGLLDSNEAGCTFEFDDDGRTALADFIVQKAGGRPRTRALTLTFGRSSVLDSLRGRGWHPTKLREESPAATFDVMLALGSALNAFDDETIADIVEVAVAQLKPGGSFILEATSFYHACHAVCNWSRLSDGLLLREADFDPTECAQLVRHLIVTQDRLTQVAARFRTPTCPEWLRLLQKHRLVPFDIRGDWDEQTYTDSSPRLIICARKGRAG